jgi:hypothetical protein
VDEAAKIPFQKFVTLEIAAGSWDDTETIDLGPDVPGNYRMVIEFVSFQGRIPHDQVPSIAIHTNNGLPNYIAPVMLGPVDEFTHFQGSQASRIYNSAKSFQVNLHRFAHEASGTVRAYVAINGYLVPVPAP